VSAPVSPEGAHVCSGQPRECWAQPHRPYMNDAPALQSYHMMLVRHGLA
jgi:hypothetical protein